MVFNSLLFFPFFFGALLAQCWVKSWRARKAWLVAFSYAFYAAWYPPAIVLLWASTIFDFLVAGALERSNSARMRRWLLGGSVALNLGVLFGFKYLGFMLQNVGWALRALGVHATVPVPSPVLPVGISFYTFMSLSYVIDVYRRARSAERDPLDFALFIGFFPHLVAGPIVRAGDFLPQCKVARRPTLPNLAWGFALLAIGLFQKVVLADAWLGPQADRVFSAPAQAFAPRDAWLATLAFGGQIYCDFSGYSTCALGAAAALGFRLPENFRSPYVAQGFSDFWRRWHISLSTWLRDYVYIGLGGSRHGELRTLRNLMVTMLLGGLWHGASWTFVVWGALHGAFLCAERVVRRLIPRERRPPPWWQGALAMMATWVGVAWAWVFFRAPSFSLAWSVTQGLVGFGGSTSPIYGGADALLVISTLLGLGTAQWLTREQRLEELVEGAPRWALASAAAALLVSIVTMAGEDRAFIYFQF